MYIISCVQGHINHKQQRQSSHPVMVVYSLQRKRKRKRREKSRGGIAGRRWNFYAYLFQFQRCHYIFPRWELLLAMTWWTNNLLDSESIILHGQSGHERNLLSYVSCIIVSTATQMMFLALWLLGVSWFQPVDHSGSCGPSSAPSCQNNQSVSWITLLAITSSRALQN